jgi:hypothetical protein
MKITRNIFDNGKKIVHITYSKEDIKKAKIKAEEAEKQREELEKQRKKEIEEIKE